MTRIVMQIPLPAECFMHNFPVCGHTNQRFAVMVVLYKSRLTAVLRSVPHLHSTMVLLIHFYTQLFRNFSAIYIPLWFYLYFMEVNMKNRKLFIYIPLWFYLYLPNPLKHLTEC